MGDEPIERCHEGMFCLGMFRLISVLKSLDDRKAAYLENNYTTEDDDYWK